MDGLRLPSGGVRSRLKLPLGEGGSAVDGVSEAQDCHSSVEGEDKCQQSSGCAFMITLGEVSMGKSELLSTVSRFQLRIILLELR